MEVALKAIREEVVRLAAELRGLSMTQVASILGVRKERVRELIASGQLVAYVEGRRQRVTIEEVRNYQKRRPINLVADPKSADRIRRQRQRVAAAVVTQYTPDWAKDLI